MIDPPDIFKASILIVDDQQANVMLLEQMLAEAGYESVSSTQDPFEVRELHRQNRYDLILLDLQMPGMDGFQVLESLKEVETGAYLPVLVITAQPEHKMQALKAGAKDFIGKPFDLTEVLIRVYNMLEIRLLHSKLALHNYGRLDNSQRIAGLGDWEYDFARNHMVWSEGVYRILGISREDLRPDSEAFYRLVHPDDLAFIHAEKKAASEGPLRADFEHRIIRPDGEVRHFRQITEMRLDDEGRPAHESGTLQDITDRKRSEGALRQSEERFKFVARVMSDVVWDWNIAEETLWWNDGFLTTFGFTAGEIDPGVASRTDRIHPDERGRVLDGIRLALAGDAESWSDEYRFRRKDETYAVVQDRGFILRDPAGEAIRMVGGMRDVTAQKKAEAQKLHTQRMESIGTLAGGIAHDLNNVLTPILLSIELLKRRADGDARQLKTLDLILSSGLRGAALVRQVLSFAGGVEGRRVTLPLAPVLEDLEGIIRGTFPRDIDLALDVSPALWAVVGDPTQLHQVLLNLAVNARDAMPHGGTLTLGAANITIDAQYAGTARQEIQTGPHVLLQVTDTGTGMPPAVLDRIFEPFFTTKELGKGTGIGLATARAIVLKHGGFIHVYSEPGNGTTFKVYLPATPTLQPAPPHAAPAEPPQGRGELVLVVDDEFSIREITQQTLEACGYRVLTARDGLEATTLYAEQFREISVVVTDMMMPVMDGPAAILALLRINPAARIIAASGLDTVDNVDKARDAGITDFLPKPYTAETLLALLREVVDRPAKDVSQGV